MIYDVRFCSTLVSVIGGSEGMGIMLGEKIGSTKGQTTMKPLPAVNGLLVMESVEIGSGTIAGAEVTVMATFSSSMRANGSWYGECPNSGVLMAADGVATGTYSATGAPTADGGFTFRGIAYFETVAPSLAALNGGAFVFEYETNADGQSTWDLWEWK